MTGHVLGPPPFLKAHGLHGQPNHADCGGAGRYRRDVNFAFGRPAIRLIGCAGAFLTVSALWQLVTSMM